MEVLAFMSRIQEGTLLCELELPVHFITFYWISSSCTQYLCIKQLDKYQLFSKEENLKYKDRKKIDYRGLQNWSMFIHLL